MLPRQEKSLLIGAGSSRKALTYLTNQIGKGGLSATKIAVGKDARAHFAKNRNDEIMRWERARVGKNSTLTRDTRVKAGAWSKKKFPEGCGKSIFKEMEGKQKSFSGERRKKH